MKTPATRRKVIPIEVRPPRNRRTVRWNSAAPSPAEAREIARAIRPRFAYYADQYDTKKYWPEVYKTVLREFRHPARVGQKSLREAILWKYGHLGKPAIPATHERLIAQLERNWRAIAAELPKQPADAFAVLDQKFGAGKRFVTVAFLLHLLHPRKVPIIDQHNFRAVSELMASVRPGWQRNKHPASYDDLKLVADFMASVLRAMHDHARGAAFSARELDKFLMMYGKAIKTLPAPASLSARRTR